MGLLIDFLTRGWHPSSKDPALLELFGGRAVASGATVTESTALGSTAVYQAVRILAETVSTVPLFVYRRNLKGGKEKAQNHSLFNILHDLPNPEMTSVELRDSLMGQLALRGNAYAEIERDNGARVIALWPLRADRMEVLRIEDRLVYRYTLPTGQTVDLPAINVMHLRGLSTDGIMGYSPIRLARESLGLTLAADEFGARFFGNGAHLGGALTHPGTLEEPAIERLKTSIREQHEGLSNAHRFMILEEGMKWEKIGTDPEDAQFLQTRKFQVSEVARLFNIPLHLLQEQSPIPRANVEQQFIEFIVLTMRPWYVRWEQAIKRDLFLASERSTFFAEFSVEGLLRGDSQARAQFYQTMMQIGAFSINKVLELENENPIGPEGDQHFVPLNWTPIGSSSGSNGSNGNRAGLPGLEYRSATSRRRLGRAHLRLFSDAGSRIIKREKADVMQAAERFIGRRDIDAFINWLEDFYLEHPSFITRQMAPVMLAYSDSIQAEAAGEIGAGVGMTDEMERFVRDYLNAYATRHVGSSMGQLREVVNLNPEEPIEAMEKRFDEWDQTRAEKIARRETVQLGNAVTTAVFAAAAIQRLKWITFGKNCPYCDDLDGRIIGISSQFLGEGEQFKPDGAEAPLVPRTKIRHAPIHGGCDCSIVAA